MRRARTFFAVFGLMALLGTVQLGGAGAETAEVKRYNVVFAGTATTDGFTIDGGTEAALALVTEAGGTVIHDLTDQIGVVTAISADSSFAETMAASDVVEEVGEDFVWKAFPSFDEAVASGELTVVQSEELPDTSEPGTDPGELLQWALELVCVNPDERPGCAGTTGSHPVQAGSPLVEVGILDTGIDATHVDFFKDGVSNVNCAKGADFTTLGTPTPCIDNQFHGTHVAGIVGARVNGIGVAGVAPNVELIPVKVCDTTGFCYSSSTVAGITHAADMKFEVINMSFFVDDEIFLQSTEYKCMSDPVQRAFRQANERAIQYARNQGVVPVAALGNSDDDLAHPPEPYDNECEVVPAETQGVIGTMALGANSQKAGYSNYGSGAVDVAAPGGSGQNLNCANTVLSTIPGELYGCFQGTSMASPHASGVAALIVSEFGTLGSDGDVRFSPTKVESYLQSTTVDIGLEGYDECFGNGRINALRAVLHDTSNVYDATAPFCPEYEE